jgi:hypothetical protein
MDRRLAAAISFAAAAIAQGQRNLHTLIAENQVFR